MRVTTGVDSAPRLLNVHSGGNTSPVVPYYRTGDFDLLFFLLDMSAVDVAVGAVAECVRAYGDRRVFVVLSFMWHVNEYVARDIALQVQRMKDAFRAPDNYVDNLLILCSAPDEHAELAPLLPAHAVVLVNSSFSVSEALMRIEPAVKIYRCAHNARPAGFKNHQLTAGLEGVVNIAYGAAFQRQIGDYVEIADFNDGPIFWDVDGDRVRELLNRSMCGIILSNVEGNCYASAEYLACGLPVVSTRSLGGRDVYYDDYNAIIIDNDAHVLRQAVQVLVERIERGEVTPEGVRARFLREQERQRRALAAALSRLTGVPQPTMFDHVCATARADSQLKSLTNRYVVGVRPA